MIFKGLTAPSWTLVQFINLTKILKKIFWQIEKRWKNILKLSKFYKFDKKVKKFPDK